MTIRESLKRFRKEFNLTRTEVAEALGIKVQSYVYEVKDVTPSAQVILDLAKHYNVSADYLLGIVDNPDGSKTVATEEDLKTLTATVIQSSQALTQSVQVLQRIIERQTGGAS